MSSLNQQLNGVTEELNELAHLEGIAKLQSVKNFLNNEIKRLSAKKQSIEKELENSKKIGENSSDLGCGSELGKILITNYMWDQTNEYVKIYIEVDKNEKIETSQILLKFALNSKTSFICYFGKYRFTLSRLYKDVDDLKSTVKITKSNRLIITLYKCVPENWASLNAQENSFKKSLTEDKGLESDPSAGLMKLMKQMYDEGDDEIKRSIAKSWYESQNKQGMTPDLGI